MELFAYRFHYLQRYNCLQCNNKDFVIYINVYDCFPLSWLLMVSREICLTEKLLALNVKWDGDRKTYTRIIKISMQIYIVLLRFFNQSRRIATAMCLRDNGVFKTA